MAIDEELHSIVSVFRQPAKIVRFSMRDGTSSGEGDVCSDADDVFVDARRRRVYVICGQGMVDVLDRATFRRLDRFPTSAGARTGLYVASADRLFVVAPPPWWHRGSGVGAETVRMNRTRRKEKS
jgi:hypothetical protein